MVTRKQALFCCLILAQSLWALPLNHSDFRVIENPLVIETRKTQPPFAAFEILEDQPAWTESWASLREPSENFEPINFKTNQLQSSKTLRIEEIVISRNDFEFSPTPLPATTETAQAVVVEEMEFQKPAPSREWLKDLTPKQRDRMMQAHSSYGTLDENWDLPSTESLIEQKFKQVLDVEKQKDLAASGALNNSGVQVSGVNHQGVPKPGFLEEKDFVVDKPGRGNDHPTFASRDVSEPSKNIFISGPVQLINGLALTDQTHLELRRFEDGIAKEPGKIDLTSGKFQIEVEQTVGVLVATLTDNKGNTIGRGSYRLSHLPLGSADQKNIPNITLDVAPTQSGILGKTISANSFSGQTIVAQNSTLNMESLEQSLEVDPKTGLFKFEDLKGRSLVLAKLEAKGFVPSQAVVGAGKNQPILMFPEEKVEALYSLLKETHEFVPLKEGGNLIWGRITQSGKAVAGIEVRIDGYEALRPIYFNDIGIPDARLKMTSGNGSFVFIDVAEGHLSLTAAKNKTYLGHLNLVAAGGHISSGDLEIGGLRDNVDVKIFDAFTGEPRSSSVALQSLESEISIDESGIKTVTISQINRNSLAWVDPGSEYEQALYQYNDQDDYIHFPLIHTEWLQAMRAGLRIDDAVEAGTVIGFVEDEFEVFLANGEHYANRNILFFDGQGNPSAKSVAGGGFILFNVPIGTQSIVVVSTTSQVQSRVTTVDPSRTSVLQFRSE